MVSNYRMKGVSAKLSICHSIVIHGETGRAGVGSGTEETILSG